MKCYKTKEPGWLSRYSDSLRAGRSGDRIPVGGESFRRYPDRLRGPPSHLCNGYLVFPGGKGSRGVALTTHPHLLPRFTKKSRALYLYLRNKMHYLSKNTIIRLQPRHVPSPLCHFQGVYSAMSPVKTTAVNAVSALVFKCHMALYTP